MSLFLLTKDAKLRGAINRQLYSGCISASSAEQFSKIKSSLLSDQHPIVLIDETFFSEQGIIPFLDYILCAHIIGPKIILTSQRWRKSEHDFVSERNFGILSKPFSIDQMIKSVIEIAGIEAIVGHLTEEQLNEVSEYMGKDWYASILVGESAGIKNIHAIVRQIGKSFSSVHINGETGTGKEVVASLLRKESGCITPYVTVNCSSIPYHLADSFIFGHEQGAFTDAKTSRKGIVKQADGGLLFLDEIEDLAFEIQGKFLRLLETKQFSPLGSDVYETSDFRLISASNKSLSALRNSGQLRFDLFNRLSRLVITIPPLRERKEDIPLLVKHYLKKKGEGRVPDNETMDRILAYDWPGNVRELFNELEQLVFFAQEEDYLRYSSILTESVLKKVTK